MLQLAFVWQAILPAGGLSGRRLGFGHSLHLGEKPSGAGNRACSRLSGGFSNLDRPAVPDEGVSLALCASRVPERSLRNSSRIEMAAWKGRLQARLPATRKAKAECRLSAGS